MNASAGSSTPFARHEDDLLRIEEPGEEPAAFDTDARAELREYYGTGPEGAVLPVLAARHAERLSERLPNITHYAQHATHPEFRWRCWRGARGSRRGSTRATATP